MHQYLNTIGGTYEAVILSSGLILSILLIRSDTSLEK